MTPLEAIFFLLQIITYIIITQFIHKYSNGCATRDVLFSLVGQQPITSLCNCWSSIVFYTFVSRTKNNQKQQNYFVVLYRGIGRILRPIIALSFVGSYLLSNYRLNVIHKQVIYNQLYIVSLSTFVI